MAVLWAREDYDIHAAIWDLKHIVQIDSAKVGMYGYGGMAQWVIFFGIALPPLQSRACFTLAEKLHAVFFNPDSATRGNEETTDE